MLYTGKGDGETTITFGPDASGLGYPCVFKSGFQTHPRFLKRSGALDEPNAFLGM
jgi:hypothetical protein